MLTPRPYLSFSQMTLFEMSPEKYIEKYIYGHKERISRNMAYGSQFANGLEDEEATGDPLLDLMMARIPKFELMDKPLEADLPNGKETIHLLAKPDSAKKDYTAFYEYKTSVRRWTQRMADESGRGGLYGWRRHFATLHQFYKDRMDWHGKSVVGRIYGSSGDL